MMPGQSAGRDGSPGHVLVAEDELYLQRMLKRSLENCGFSVTLAGNGEEALGLWRGHRFDAILMDLRMPVLCGCKTALQIRTEETEKGLKPVPIVALTAVYSEVKQQTYEACGMNDILPKPIAGPALCEAIRRHLAG